MGKPATAKAMADDFEQFAKENPSRHGGPLCWVCQIPERDFVNQKFKEGHTRPTIQRYLVQRIGYSKEDCTHGKINRHFTYEHHLRSPEVLKALGYPPSK